MADFERFQTLMLDSLYGLLDAEQETELATFMANSPDADRLRQQAAEMRAQLGQAAKSAFPTVQFTPPSRHAKPTPAPAHAKPRSVKPPAASRPWVGWLLVGTSLLVVLGLGIPAFRQAYDHRQQAKKVVAARTQFETSDHTLKNQVAAYNARRETADRTRDTAAAEFDEIEKNFTIALADAEKKIENKGFIVRLTGPDRAQPGAPNEWRFEMYRRNSQMVMPRKVEWSVKDQNNNVLFADSREAPGKEVFREPPTIQLPVSFWEKVKPESDLHLEVIAFDDQMKSSVNAVLKLARPVFVTHLTTDKPLYKQGETVWFRSLTLDRATFTPPEKDMLLEFRMTKPGGQPEPIVVDGLPLRNTARSLKMVGPQQPLLGPDKKPLRGLGCGSYEIVGNAPGGEYVLSVVDVTPVFDEVTHAQKPREVVLETRKFNVIEYKPETFEKTLEFDGKSYGPGDVIQVRCTVSRTQGGKVKRGAVAAHAIIDNQNVQVSHPGKTDDEGVIRLKLTVPKNITRGVGTLTVTFTDGGEAEPIIRPIPLVGRTINVEFFPEGGDLIAGVANRVYFQASTPTGKPADLQGYITDGTQVIAEVASLTDADLPGMNRGQGAFTFTPKAGTTYYLKLKKPLGIIEPYLKKPVTAVAITRGLGLAGLVGGPALVASLATGFELPAVKAEGEGVALASLDPVTNSDKPVRFTVQSQSRKTLVVGAYARGQLIAHQRLTVEPGQPVEVKLQPDSPAGGVTRLTIFEERAAPEGQTAKLDAVAERLVYRKPAQSLLLNVNPDKARYNPGSNVGLDVLAMTENEKAVPAIIMVAVVNQNVLTMADEKTGRLMNTHFFLASEVRKADDLEHADFLLGENPKAAVALDLLLGTQGWRRFAEQNAQKPVLRDREEVERMLVANGQKAQAPIETFRQEEEKIVAEYQPKLERALSRAEDAVALSVNVQGEFEKENEASRVLEAQRLAAAARYHEALSGLEKFEENGVKARTVPFARLSIALLLLASIWIVVGMVRRGNKSLAYFAAAAGCLALCAVSMVTSAVANRSDDKRRDLALGKHIVIRPDGHIEIGDQVGAMKRDDRAEPAADRQVDPAKEFLGRDPADGMFGGGGVMKGQRMAPALPPMAMPRAELMKNKVMEMRMMNAAEKADKDVRRFDKGEKAALQVADAKKAFRGLEEQKQMRDGFARNMGREREDEAPAKRQAGKPGVGFAQDKFAGAAAPIMELAKAKDALHQQLEQLESYPGFYVREFKFQKKNFENAVRNDFTETVCWQPIIVLPENGRAEIQFQLSDSIARYQVLVAGHTLDGRLGAVTMQIEARKPFTVDPKLPIEVTSSDRIDVPVRVVNDSDMHRAVTFTVTPTGLIPADTSIVLKDGHYQDWIELGANAKGRKVVSFRPNAKQGEASIQVVGTSDPVEAKDEILRAFRVVPDGFPVAGSVSDLLEKQAHANFELPAFVKGTLKVQVNVYPTTLADLQSGLESLMREPGGCFEQTSTANYPNLLILDYLKSADQAKPELTQRAKGMLERGYAKLIAFECPQSDAQGRRGFEWFGQMDQQHQALTAYGLLQFKDLAKVFPVDPEMIKRTQQYLLAQRDGKGGFKRNARALDTFGQAPEQLTNAFIVWALVESDPDDKESLDLTKEIEALKKQANDDAQVKDDPYFLALVANALLRRSANGNREAAVALLDRIVEKNLKNGAIEGAQTSITRSGGRDLVIETTAMTVLAFLRSGEKTHFIKPVKECTKWIGQQRGGHGGFGSTQSTILALKALIEHTKASRRPAESGEVRLTINGTTFKKAFTEKDQEVITLDIEKPEEIFKTGANEALVEISTKEAYPFALTWSGSTAKPVSAEKCAVEVAAKFDRNNVVEGESVKVDVSLKNKLDAGHGMAVAIVGLPGGCRLPADMKELIELREKGDISYYEVRGRDLVLYWRGLKPKQEINLSFHVIAEVPGEYAGPATRGYLYYNADHKHWIDPLRITIAPSNQAGNDDVAAK